MALYAEYITKSQDRLDLICWAAYGNATDWRPLLQANPTLPIKDEYEAGIRLAVPIIENATNDTNTALLPPWKK